MYTPNQFSITDTAEMQRIVREHPLGVLVTGAGASLEANHLPFEFEPGPGGLGRLRAHVARANPVWQACADGADVLVVFHGAQGYISPNWYPSKHETHRLVPTWNYEAVHVHGRLSVQDDEKFVRGVLARLTRTHEAGEPKAWKMSDADPAFIAGLLQAVVGIEIDIVRMQGKAKLSQNREARDLQGAVDVLRQRGGDALAQAMARRLA